MRKCIICRKVEADLMVKGMAYCEKCYIKAKRKLNDIFLNLGPEALKRHLSPEALKEMEAREEREGTWIGYKIMTRSEYEEIKQ